MSDHQHYHALAAAVRFKDITSSASNRALFHRITNNDPSLKYLRITNDDLLAPRLYFNVLVLRGEDDLGWLGYFIGENTTLTDMYIDHLPGGSGQVASFFKGVERNESIRKVDFWGGGIADDGEGLSAINMPHVTSIKVYELERDSARHFAIGLRGCKSLERYEGRLTVEIIDALGTLPLIESIVALNFPRPRPHVEHANDDTDNLGTDGFVALEVMLRNVTKLNSLSLYGVRIGGEGMKSLAAGLVQSSSLSKCVLSSNNIGDEGVKTLAAALADNRSMQELDLSHNNISDEGLVCLASSLVHNGVSELNVSSNSIGDKGLEAMAKSLRRNRNLRVLDLSENTALTEVGLSALSCALQSRTCKLKILSLNGLNVGNTVGNLLGRALSINKSIATLRCQWGTRFDNDRLRALTSGLRHNNTLRVLELSGNTFINAASLRHFKQYLWSANCALEELRFERIDVGDEAAFALADALARNKSLEVLSCGILSFTRSTGRNAFSKLLCDSTSVSSVYLSNHTLQQCWYRNFPWLDVNKVCNNPSMAAKCKILKCFPVLDMTPLFQWNLKCLPLVIDWFQTITFSPMIASHADWTQIVASVQSRELSAIYKFISGMPGLVVKGCKRYLDQQLQMIRVPRCRLQEEMKMLEEREKSALWKYNACDVVNDYKCYLDQQLQVIQVAKERLEKEMQMIQEREVCLMKV